MKENNGSIYPHIPSCAHLQANYTPADLKDLVILGLHILLQAIPLAWNDQVLPHREYACSPPRPNSKIISSMESFPVF